MLTTAEYSLNLRAQENKFPCLRHKSRVTRENEITSGFRKGQIGSFESKFTPFKIFFGFFGTLYFIISKVNYILKKSCPVV